MLTRIRRRVVEEVVMEFFSPNSYEAWIKQRVRERMKYEQNRLDRFTTGWLDYYQLDVSVAQRLAKAGFYCLGLGYTECFSCGLSKDLYFWKEGHHPGTVHRTESPDCKFITGQSDNVSIERWMRYEQNRLKSFTSWLFDKYQLDVSVAQRLAKAGFYRTYTGYTKCFSCWLSKYSSFWREGHDPETVHRTESPDCKFITGQSDNVPIESMNYEQNRLDSFDLFFWEEGHDPETVHREESPNCKFIKVQSDNVPIKRWVKYEQNRLNSFPPWWLEDNQLYVSVRQRLAKAGFYCWGFDNTECFSCGLSKDLTFWQEGHDPETVHREESPNCKFITGQSDNVPINNSNFFTKILLYVWPFRTNSGETLNNKTTTQQVTAKEQIDNQFESYAQGSIVVSDTDVKQNKITQKTKKEAKESKFRNPINAVRSESIEENTITFTSPEPDVGNEKAASGSTCRRRHLISATRGSCSSQEINQNSVIVSQSLQSSAFTTQTITSGSCVTSFDISERRSPIVSPISILCLAVYYKRNIFFHFLIQLL